MSEENQRRLSVVLSEGESSLTNGSLLENRSGLKAELTINTRRGYRPGGPGNTLPAGTFADWFGNANPVEVEIGCGKGGFLLEQARQNPGVNFVGLDWSFKWLARPGTPPASGAGSNIRFFWVRAQEFFERIPVSSVAVVHIYFPDPWPKRRHRERRLIQPGFLDLLHGRLERGGRLEIATDVSEYFFFIRQAVARSCAAWRWMRTRKNERLFCLEGKTRYERKFEAEGRDRYYLELVKP